MGKKTEALERRLAALESQVTMLVSGNKPTETYKALRAPSLYIKPAEGGELRVTAESQLDRIEKKMDSILEHLGNKEKENK